MFKCNACKEIFEEPKKYTDWVEAWGHMVPIYSYTCPHCDSDDFEEYTGDDEDDWKRI